MQLTVSAYNYPIHRISVINDVYRDQASLPAADPRRLQLSKLQKRAPIITSKADERSPAVIESPESFNTNLLRDTLGAPLFFVPRRF